MLGFAPMKSLPKLAIKEPAPAKSAVSKSAKGKPAKAAKARRTAPSAVPTSASAHVALLRGVNVGGKNLLPMKDLAALFEAAGCGRVSTYIQSGNVIFVADAGTAKSAAARVSDAIERRFRLRIPVVIRSVGELRAVVRANPFIAAGIDPGAAYVAFLAGAPDAASMAALDPRRSHPDAFEVRDREVYMHLPTGAGKTKLTTAYFDAKLRTVSTVRNWRTTLKLLELAEAVADGG